MAEWELAEDWSDRGVSEQRIVQAFDVLFAALLPRGNLATRETELMRQIIRSNIAKLSVTRSRCRTSNAPSLTSTTTAP
jgi:hypothetical protein